MDIRCKVKYSHATVHRSRKAKKQEAIKWEKRISLGRGDRIDLEGGLGMSGVGSRRGQVLWEGEEKILGKMTGIGGGGISRARWKQWRHHRI